MRGRVDETKERNEWSPSGETGLGDSARKRDHVLDEDSEMNSNNHSNRDEGWREYSYFAYLRMPMVFSLA